MPSVAELDTPAVTVRLDIMDSNIARVHGHLARHGIANRPHIKTHKIPALGNRQMAAGAVGITCQKLGEVEVFTDAGVADDVLLTFNVIGRAKTERLAALTRRLRRLAVVFDNEVVARGLSEAAREHRIEIPFLVECDTGFGRNGVQTPEAAFELARAAMKLPGLRFEGLMTFPNREPTTRMFLEQALELFKRSGIPVPVVSGSARPRSSRRSTCPCSPSTAPEPTSTTTAWWSLPVPRPGTTARCAYVPPSSAARPPTARSSTAAPRCSPRTSTP